MTRFMETIRRWAGWCPETDVKRIVRMNPIYDVNFPSPPGGRVHVEKEVVLDYGHTAPKPRFFAGLFVGVVGVVLLLFLVRSVVGASRGELILGFSILAIGLAAFLNDAMKKVVEFRPDSIVVRRPFLRPLVIEKKSIKTAEAKKNRPPVPLPYLAAATALVLAFSAGMLSVRLLEFPGEVLTCSDLLNMAGYPVSVSIFSVWILYHAYIRWQCSLAVVITTEDSRILTIYTDDAGTMADAIGARSSPSARGETDIPLG